MNQSLPTSLDLASCQEDMLAGFRSSLKCSFYCLTTSSDWVSSWLCWLSNNWAGPCFLFRSHLTVCPELEASRKSISMASSNSYHNRVFAFVTALLAKQCMSAGSTDLPANQTRKVSFSSLTAMFTCGEVDTTPTGTSDLLDC